MGEISPEDSLETSGDRAVGTRKIARRELGPEKNEVWGSPKDANDGPAAG